MDKFIKLQPHPFPLLLYLEWILLGMTFLGELSFVYAPLRPTSQEATSLGWLMTISSTIVFGVMGLRLPSGTLIFKVLYTGLEFGLIILGAFGGHKGIIFFSSLLLVVAIRSCLIFGLIGRLIVAASVLTAFVATAVITLRDIRYIKTVVVTPPSAPPLPLVQNPISQDLVRSMVLHLMLTSGLMFGLVILFVLLLVNALLAERQSRQKLAIAHDQLRRYALLIEDRAALQERNRIAREIHDALGHFLTAQSIQLENAQIYLGSNLDKTQKFLSEARQLGSKALKEVRYSVAALRSDPLKGRSLESAIKLLMADFQRQTGVAPECILRLSCNLPVEVSTTVYRIVQEALTNIAKHSAATEVKIDLQAEEKFLYLRVEDNGRGFNPTSNTTGFGLQGMRERTTAVGGEFQLASALGDGSQIIAKIPLSRLYP